VFDTAGSVLLIDLEHERELRREARSLCQKNLVARVGEILKFDADVLICGAISAALESLLLSSGLQVIGFLCGPVDEVVAAFLSGNIAGPEFSMPGCHGRRQRNGPGGRNRRARGFGLRGEGYGRAAGLDRIVSGGPAAGLERTCVCPKCGERVPHAAGQPCRRMACPKCGTTMTRA
jgi:hypothetical protein